MAYTSVGLEAGALAVFPWLGFGDFNLTLGGQISLALTALYVFVSRDCEKVKMLRFETSGWCMYYVRLLEGGFRWSHSGDPSAPLLTVERRQLLWLLEGLEFEQPKAPKPVAAHGLL